LLGEEPVTIVEDAFFALVKDERITLQALAVVEEDYLM
jgi:hypothetical protein